MVKIIFSGRNNLLSCLKEKLLNSRRTINTFTERTHKNFLLSTHSSKMFCEKNGTNPPNFNSNEKMGNKKEPIPLKRRGNKQNFENRQSSVASGTGKDDLSNRDKENKNKIVNNPQQTENSRENVNRSTEKTKYQSIETKKVPPLKMPAKPKSIEEKEKIKETQIEKEKIQETQKEKEKITQKEKEKIQETQTGKPSIKVIKKGFEYKTPFSEDISIDKEELTNQKYFKNNNFYSHRLLQDLNKYYIGFSQNNDFLRFKSNFSNQLLKIRNNIKEFSENSFEKSYVKKFNFINNLITTTTNDKSTRNPENEEKYIAHLLKPESLNKAKEYFTYLTTSNDNNIYSLLSLNHLDKLSVNSDFNKQNVSANLTSAFFKLQEEVDFLFCLETLILHKDYSKVGKYFFIYYFILG